MVSTLADNDKKGAASIGAKAPAPSAGDRTDFAATAKEAVGAYGAAATVAAQWEQTKKEVERDKHRPWSEDPWKRALIISATRVFSIFFFTAGNFWVKKAVKNYDASKPFWKQPEGAKNPATLFASAVDAFIGRPVYEVAKLVSGGNKDFATRMVTFRPRLSANSSYDGSKIWGHSWGKESTLLAGGFYIMSFFNGLAQDLIQQFDPHVKKSYRDDEGYFKPLAAAKSLFQSAAHHALVSGGEDLAVCATTYPWAMSGISYVIDKVSPGFKIVSDHGLYGGGGFKLGDNGLSPRDKGYRTHLAGNFRPENAVDLGVRFITYNGGLGVPGTIHFREIVNHIKNRIAGRPSSLYGPSTEKEEYKGVIGTISYLFKWWLGSTIKATAAMVPAVMAFVPTRATQLMHQGLFIHKEYGMVTYDDKDSNRKRPFKVNHLENLPSATDIEKQKKANKHGAPFNYSKYNGNFMGEAPPFDRIEGLNSLREDQVTLSTGKPLEYKRNMLNPAAWPDPTREHNQNRAGWTKDDMFHPYHTGKTRIGKAVDGLGRAQYWASKRLDGIANDIDNKSPANGFKRFIGMAYQDKPGLPPLKNFTQQYTRDVISYAPYFVAKDRFNKLMDKHRTGLAIYRMFEGVASGNWKEAKAGGKELRQSILQQSFDDPARELEAQRVDKLPDPSQNEEFSNTAQAISGHGEKTWAQRKDHLVTGHAPEKAIKVKGSDGKSLEDRYGIARRGNYSEGMTSSADRHADEQEMREVLRTSRSPSPSVH